MNKDKTAMDKVQFLSIEITDKCNLGCKHADCPNMHPERYAHVDATRELNDGMIVRIATRFYREFGFAGLVAFHYYNSPLMAARRMFSVINQIREQVPQSRFCLWTNGTMLPEDCSQFSVFEQAHVTHYPDDPPKNLDGLRRVCRAVQVHHNGLDRRLEGLGAAETAPCVRIFTEFIVDYYGNVHLCCFDWRGLASPGNVFTAGLSACVKRFQEIREAIAIDRMATDAPEACLRCQFRTASVTNFDAASQQRAITWRKWMIANHSQANLGRPAVVFVFYRGPNSNMPVQRLIDHFEWNHAFYTEGDARVFVVTDQEYPVPHYAECCIYPDPMPLKNGKPIFSHARTWNFGIRRALETGRCPIITTDCDMAFTPDSWRQLLSVNDKQASVPVCWMALDYEHRCDVCHVHPNTETHARQCLCSHADHGATGTIGMTADNWRTIQWDERCVGYGADDGIVLASIRKAGIELIGRPGRSDCVPIFHIAHAASAPQVNFSGRRFVRQDAWDSEFNPVNFAENRRYYKS